MKNFITAGTLLALATVSLTSCYDRDRDPMPEYSSVALVNATLDPATATIPLLPARAAAATNPTRPEIRFTIDLYSQRDTKVSKVFVYRTLRRGSTAAVYSYSPRFLLAEVTTFPTTLTFNSQQLLTDMVRLTTDANTGAVTAVPYIPPTATAVNRIFTGDTFIFTYEYELENGQRIVLTPTTKQTSSSPTTQAYETITGSQINAPYALVVPIRQ